MKTCDACRQAVDTPDGQCTFCHAALCRRHIIHASFFGEVVAWCDACRTRYDADQAEHRADVGRLWHMVEEVPS